MHYFRAADHINLKKILFKCLQITLPTAAQVVITRSVRHFINIRMTPSTVDIGKTEGLSGNFNGNKDDDLKTSDGRILKYSFRPDDFSLSWR